MEYTDLSNLENDIEEEKVNYYEKWRYWNERFALMFILSFLVFPALLGFLNSLGITIQTTLAGKDLEIIWIGSSALFFILTAIYGRKKNRSEKDYVSRKAKELIDLSDKNLSETEIKEATTLITQINKATDVEGLEDYHNALKNTSNFQEEFNKTIEDYLQIIDENYIEEKNKAESLASKITKEEENSPDKYEALVKPFKDISEKHNIEKSQVTFFLVFLALTGLAIYARIEYGVEWIFSIVLILLSGIASYNSFRNTR